MHDLLQFLELPIRVQFNLIKPILILLYNIKYILFNLKIISSRILKKKNGNRIGLWWMNNFIIILVNIFLIWFIFQTIITNYIQLDAASTLKITKFFYNPTKSSDKQNIFEKCSTTQYSVPCIYELKYQSQSCKSANRLKIKYNMSKRYLWIK